MKDRYLPLSSRACALALAGILLAVLAATWCFRSSLTDIDQLDEDTLAGCRFQQQYLPRDLAVMSDEQDIEDAWGRRGDEDDQEEMTPAQKSVVLGMQLDDPGAYADAILVVTATEHSAFCYGAFATGFRIDTVLRSPASRSRLQEQGSTFLLPEIELATGDEIFVYEEFGAAMKDSRPAFASSSIRSPFTSYLTPAYPGRQYLVFLDLLPKHEGQALSGCRFVAAPTIYSMIPLARDGSSYRVDARMACGGFPERPDSESADAPLGTSQSEPADESYEQAYEKAAAAVPEQTWGDAEMNDLYMENAETERLWQENAERIVSSYLG